MCLPALRFVLTLPFFLPSPSVVPRLSFSRLHYPYSSARRLPKYVDRYTCRTPHFHMYSRSADRTAQMTCVHGSRGSTSSSPNCVPKTYTHPRVMFHLAPHRTLNTSTSSLSPTSPVLHSSTSPTPDLLSTHPFTYCKDPRQDGSSTEYQPLTGYEFKRIELNRTFLNLSNQELDDQKDLRKLVSNRCPAANPWYIQLTIRQRALQCHPTRTSKTNNYVRCWFHCCIPKYRGNVMQQVYRSEKQMHNEPKLITQGEKAWCQVLLET